MIMPETEFKFGWCALIFFLLNVYLPETTADSHLIFIDVCILINT